MEFNVHSPPKPVRKYFFAFHYQLRTDRIEVFFLFFRIPLKHFRDSIEATNSICTRHHSTNISFFFSSRIAFVGDRCFHKQFLCMHSRRIFSGIIKSAQKYDVKFCNRNNTISYKMNFYSMKWCFWIRGVVAL